MSTSEEEYKQQLKDAGVDMPELEDTAGDPDAEKEKAKAEAKAKEEADQKAKDEADEAARIAAEEGEDDGKKPNPEKNRSIYDDYKDKKKQLKEAEDKATQAERERDDLQKKLDALNNAETPEEKKEALDEFDEFAKEIDASPEMLKKMRDLFLKGIQVPQLDESLKKDLEGFNEWKAEQTKQNDVDAFEKEYTATVPILKEYFPTVSDQELSAIKDKLNEISHSKGWNDKELDYIVFKHKDQLTAMVSPKKRGLEGREAKDGDVITTDFDPNADLSKMSGPDRAKWESQYRAASKKEGLSEGSDGKKILL